MRAGAAGPRRSPVRAQHLQGRHPLPQRLARQAHAREEHLLPLMVAAGAAEADDARCVYHETEYMGAITASSFRFG